MRDRVGLNSILSWCLVIILHSSMAWAGGPLLISDVDDTIKISHVLSGIDSGLNSADIRNHFLGTALVYRSLKENSPEMRIAYVTNAPEFLMYLSHQSFLAYNSFPDGQLLLRESLFDQSFKLRTIRKLVQQHQPTSLLLIGDNGEKDISVYDQIRKENPKLKIKIYIHQVYSALNEDEKGQALKEHQVGYVTSIDLARLLTVDGFMLPVQYSQIVSQIVPELLKQDWGEDDGEIAFPSWMDCRDHFSQSKKINSGLKNRLENFLNQFFEQRKSKNLLEEYQKALQLRCSIRNIE